MGVREGPYGHLFHYGSLLLVYHDRTMCLADASPQGRHSCIGTICPQYFCLFWAFFRSFLANRIAVHL